MTEAGETDWINFIVFASSSPLRVGPNSEVGEMNLALGREHDRGIVLTSHAAKSQQ
jgi:hypothetical protein